MCISTDKYKFSDLQQNQGTIPLSQHMATGTLTKALSRRSCEWRETKESKRSRI